MERYSNKQFSNTLDDRRARFALCDLHIHSPASYDVQISYLDELDAEARDAIGGLVPADESRPDDLRRYQDDVLQAYPAERFLGALVARRNQVSEDLNLSSSDDWAVVAITDHNICKYSCQLADLAWSRRGQNRLIVLPAIELDVQFPVPNGSDSTIHLLCLFAPGTDSADVCHAISVACGQQWKEGERPCEVGDLPSFISSLRSASQHPAICIAAHVASSKGIHRECKSTIRLKGNEAAIAQLRAAASAEGLEEEEQSVRMRELEEAERRYDEELQVQTLELIGDCGFDCLQVRGPEDHRHYRRLHRHDPDKGRATLIVCSDAHTSTQVFRTGDYVPHLKIGPKLSAIDATKAFSAVQRSLRLAETRFISRPIQRSETWIEGIYLRPDRGDARQFFDHPKDGVIGLSRNLTCIVGGRGSGKSGLLDAIGFVAKPEDFTSGGATSRGDARTQDYVGRSTVMFSGHEIRLCWRFARTEIPREYRKGVFSSRYFAEPLTGDDPETTDIDDRSAESINLPNIALYRFQQLEQHASGAALRTFLDSVRGKDLQEAKDRIAEIKSELATNRTQIIDVAGEILELTNPGSALRVYAEHLRLFQEVDTDEMRAEFEKHDTAEAAGRVLAAANKRAEAAKAKFEESKLAEDIEAITYDSVSKGVELERSTEELESLKQALDRESTDSALGRIARAAQELREQLDSGAQAIKSLLEAGRERYRTVREELRQRGVPTGGNERTARRERLQDSKQALTEYRVGWERLRELLKQRNGLFELLEEAGARRTKIRRQVCEGINLELAANLDSSVLEIRAEAGERKDDKAFSEWLDQSLQSTFRNQRAARVSALVGKGIMPRHLRDFLYEPDEEKQKQFVVEKPSAAEGRINKDEVGKWVAERRGFTRLDPELTVSEFDNPQEQGVPPEVQSGLLTIGRGDTEESLSIFDHLLQLDEVEFEDRPSVHMNDRPTEQGSELRAIDEMSPGQRCSALLPILLLSGDGPLVIDQPEDNLDNRLIREVIVNVLSTMKLRRQIIIATHNPNLPVLGDAEQIIALRARGYNTAQVVVNGDLDQAEVVNEITDIMEGGREAFQYRYAVYGAHWSGAQIT